MWNILQSGWNGNLCWRKFPTNDQQPMSCLQCFINVYSANNGGIFVDVPGGTGKTFILNLILAKIRSEGKIIFIMASSGIAITLLTGGRTMHSTFKVSLDLKSTDVSMCRIRKGTSLARVVQACRLLIVNEAPVTSGLAYEALDRTLQDIQES